VEFGQYLAAATDEVKRALRGGGVAILVPPGSARGEVAKRLVEEGVVGEDDVLLYEELHRRLGLGKPLRREGGQFYVVVEGGEVPLLQYLKGGVTLRFALRQRGMVIVPRDTQEAFLVYEALLEELKEEKLHSVENVEKLVKVVFLPAFYKEGDEEAAELARVDYSHVLKGVVEEAEGVSPSLARLAKEYKDGGRLEELRRDVELLRSLYAGRAAPGLLAIAKEAASSAAKSTGLSWASSVATGAVLSHVLAALAFLKPFEAVASQLLSGLLEGVLDRAISRLKKRKDETIAAILELAKRATKAKPLVEKAVSKGGGAAGKAPPATFEALVDWAAASWGLTIEQFASVVHNLAALLEGKIATHRDVEKAVEELRRELEARWAELEKRVERLEKWVEEQAVKGLLEAGLAKVYLAPEDWVVEGFFEEVGGVLKLRRGLLVGEEGVELVETKLVDAVVEEVVGGGRIVVVKGGKGIGKTTAAAAALYRLSKGVVDGLAPAAAELYLAPGVEAYLYQLPHIVKKANAVGVFPIFYLDPSKALAYEWATAGEHRPEPLSVFAKALAELSKASRLGKAAAVVVLSNDQYEVVRQVLKSLGEEGYVREVDADEVLEREKAAFVKALVEKYSGCSGDVVERVADSVASFNDNYAVAAVLAADWLKKGGCRGEEVEKAVKEAEGNIHRFALHYLWYGPFNGDEAVARWAAPLVLATGFFGPHPPRLGEAVAVAMSPVVEEIFGAGSVRRDDNVLKWLSQPLHGILYEVIEKVARGAVYRRFGVGSDELCQGSVEGPCRLVEICSKILTRLPQRKYSNVEEVAEGYAKLVAKALNAPGPAGVRQINFLINDFLKAYDGVVDSGHWKIKYKVKGIGGVKAIEDVVDELDILSALYGLAVLPYWHPRLKPLEDWFFVGGKDVELLKLYLYPLLRERGRELVKRAVAVIDKVEGRGFYTDVDLLQAVGIAAASQWDSATDEELEKAMELVAFALRGLATFSLIVLDYFEPLLSEAWYRAVSGGAHEDRGRRKKLADWLTVAAYNVAIGDPSTLLNFFFVIGIDKSDPETVAKRFDVLYNVASNPGKLQFLEMLLYAVNWDVDIAAMLLNKLEIEEAFEEVVKRVEEFVSRLDGVEKAYAVAHLYPRLATHYTSLGELDKAVEFVNGASKALKELWGAYEVNKASMEEKLRPYLELKQVLDLGYELRYLGWHVYYHVAFVYIGASELDRAIKYAKEACKLAKKLGGVYYEITSCGLLPKLELVKCGASPVKKFEELWQKVSQDVEWLGAEVVATTFGRYVIALIFASRFSDVKKVLEKWSWALKLHSDTFALTYGALSLFNGQYLEKAVEGLPKWARANLPKFADALHDAVEAGLFAKEPSIVELARKKLSNTYGKDAVMALKDAASTSSKLFLLALVGLAHCKRGEEWGLELAKAAAWAGSGFKGIVGRLFGELYKALEGATVGKCVTDEVLKAVYKLYYLHV